jgi:hypothetical protein
MEWKYLTSACCNVGVGIVGVHEVYRLEKSAAETLVNFDVVSGDEDVADNPLCTSGTTNVQ